MHFIVITNFRKRLLILLSIVLFWVAIIASTGLLIDKTVKYTLTINSQISFICPAEFNITNVYSSDDDSSPYLQASNSDYKNFIEFSSPEENFEFSYPSIFKVEKQSFPNSEILYHIDLQNKQDKSFVGFVQVWDMPYSLEKFLDDSKQNSLQEFISFSSKKITVNKLNGYFWDYTIKSASENYRCMEVFFTKGTKLYRISYYIPEKKFNQDEYDMFWKMVNSLKIH